MENIQELYTKDCINHFNNALKENLINALFNNDIIINDDNDLFNLAKTNRIERIYYERTKTYSFVLDNKITLLYYSQENEIDSSSLFNGIISASLGKIQTIERKKTSD